MNVEEALSLTACRETDEFIVQHVLGYTRMFPPAVPQWQKPTKDGLEVLYYLPAFSASNVDALPILSVLRCNYFRVAIYQWDYAFDKTTIGLMSRDGGIEDERFIKGDTLALALCHAAAYTWVKKGDLNGNA